ncbi:MAG TPA: hypothetical protein VG326_17550 [Tepidisphaeraceae bacterium]|jgi:hypothetical protein|nr:hypothetical protein [Tepidisphaeraceae bacterium]
MDIIDPQEPAEQSRVVGEAHPAASDTPKWFGYIAVGITLASTLIGLALLAWAILWLYRRL